MAEGILDGEPTWSVIRRDQRGGLRRLTDRRVTQSDVVAPDGHRYSSVLSADDLALAALSAAALLTRAVAVRGGLGWTIMVSTAETKWRAAHPVYRERSRDADFVVSRATDLAREIQRGDRPWKLRG